MHGFVLLAFFFVTTSDYLVRVGFLPGIFKFAPEIVSAVAAAYVFAVGPRQQFRNVRSVYWLTFGAVAITMVCGVLSNAVAPGPIIGGLRYYLRPIPLFFLATVANFQDRQLRGQLQMVLAIALTQLPIAAYQRYAVTSAGRYTGDLIFGTLMVSSILSIFLICVACILTGFYLRRRMPLSTYLVTLLLVLIPTTINETKGTLVLLPIGLLATVLIGSPRERRARILIGAVSIFVAFLAIYVPTYDYFNRDRPYSVPILEFFKDTERVEGYLSKDSGLGADAPVGRVDSIVEPLPILARDPSSLVFGLGVGNVSESSVGSDVVGKYNGILGRYLVSSSSTFILEIGFLGTLLVFLLYWHILQDSIAVLRRDRELIGAFAIGWAGCTVLVAIAMFYKPMHTHASLSYLFWYWAGVVATRRATLRCAPADPPARAVGTYSRH